MNQFVSRYIISKSYRFVDGAAEQKARRPKSVFILRTCRRDWLEERSKQE